MVVGTQLGKQKEAEVNPDEVVCSRFKKGCYGGGPGGQTVRNFYWCHESIFVHHITDLEQKDADCSAKSRGSVDDARQGSIVPDA